MTYRDRNQDLSVHYETHGFPLPESVRQRFDADLDRLATILHQRPSGQLHVDLVRHARTNDYHLKTSLRIGRNLTFFHR
jgi:hypothetical protein